MFARYLSFCKTPFGVWITATICLAPLCFWPVTAEAVAALIVVGLICFLVFTVFTLVLSMLGAFESLWGSRALTAAAALLGGLTLLAFVAHLRFDLLF